uniref:Putative ovule protein n=1 Tax=Solanum chacoense TaxID=4108 RepID=A0A0V0H550_SOLCH
MNKIFEKSFIPKTQKEPLFLPPQLNTYKESLGQNKKTYNQSLYRKYSQNTNFPKPKSQVQECKKP